MVRGGRGARTRMGMKMEMGATDRVSLSKLDRGCRDWGVV